MPLTHALTPGALTARSTRHRLLVVSMVSMVAITSMGGCKKKTAAPVDSHEGHDHAAAESEAEHVDEVRLTPEAIDRYGVKVDAAQLWVLKPTIITPARVAFNTETIAHVGSPLRGRVVDVKVRLGSMVAAGDDLIIIESPELGEAQANALQAMSAAESAAPAAALAESVWKRASDLYEQSQGISLTEVQRRESEHRAAAAALRTAQSSATAAGSKLRLLGMNDDEIAAVMTTGAIVPRMSIRAAAAGQIVQRDVTLGELVGPDMESLLVIADTRSLWVLADVPETRLAGVTTGSRAWVTIGSTTGDGASRFEGEVAYVAPFIDPATRTASVRIEVPTSNDAFHSALKPGMFAQAEIVVTSRAETEVTPQIAVPDEAIQTVEGGPAVFVPVPGEPNTFQKRAVTIGRAVGGLVPVYAGLVEGESFVIAGSFILKAELGKGSAAHEH